MSLSRVLPPSVVGKLSGILTICVPEIFWSDTLHGEVLVKLKWWGSDEESCFSPRDITRGTNEGGEEVEGEGGEESVNSMDPYSVSYHIATSFILFETYLRNCMSLDFFVSRVSDGTIVGVTKVNNFDEILSKDFSSYFPIYDINTHEKVGDMRIIFTMRSIDEMAPRGGSVSTNRNRTMSIVEINEARKSRKSNAEILKQIVHKSGQLRRDMLISVFKDNSLCHDCKCEKKSDVCPCCMKTVDFVNAELMNEKEESITDLNRIACEYPDRCDADCSAEGKDKCNSPKNRCLNEEEKVSPVTVITVPEQLAPFKKRPKKNVTLKYQGHLEMTNDLDGIPGLKMVAIDPPPLLRKSKEGVYLSINCFKLTFKSVRLSTNGIKRVSHNPSIRPLENKIRAANPPGIVFSIEAVFPFTHKVRTSWMKPTVMTSKKFTGADVIIDDSAVFKIPKGLGNPWKKVFTFLDGVEVKVYWRHLNQRIPSILGIGKFQATELADLEAPIYIELTTTNSTPAGILLGNIELGVSGTFGNKLFGDNNEKPKNENISMSRSVQFLRNPTKPPASAPSIPDSHGCVMTTFDDPPLKESLDGELMSAINALNGKLNDKPIEPLEDPKEEKNNNEVDKIEGEEEPKEVKKCVSVDVSTSCSGIDLCSRCANSNLKRSVGGCCCCCKCCHGDLKTRASSRKKANNQSSKKCSSCWPTPSSGMSSKSGLENLTTHSSPVKLNSKLANPEVEEDSEKMPISSISSSDSPFCKPPIKRIPPFSTLHRYNIDVYSSDANAYYIDGELEFYLAYRFFVFNPNSKKLEFSQKKSVIELNYQSSPKSHVIHLLGLRLTDALLSLPKQYLTFQVWVRAYRSHKQHFQIARARFPIERLIEWEVTHDFSSERRFKNGNLLPPEKHFVNLRLEPTTNDLPRGLEIGMVSQLGLEIDYEKAINGCLFRSETTSEFYASYKPGLVREELVGSGPLFNSDLTDYSDDGLNELKASKTAFKEQISDRGLWGDHQPMNSDYVPTRVRPIDNEDYDLFNRNDDPSINMKPKAWNEADRQEFSAAANQYRNHQNMVTTMGPVFENQNFDKGDENTSECTTGYDISCAKRALSEPQMNISKVEGGIALRECRSNLRQINQFDWDFDPYCPEAEQNIRNTSDNYDLWKIGDAHVANKHSRPATNESVEFKKASDIPSFLKETMSPKIERDFPPGIEYNALVNDIDLHSNPPLNPFLDDADNILLNSGTQIVQSDLTFKDQDHLFESYGKIYQTSSPKDSSRDRSSESKGTQTLQNENEVSDIRPELFFARVEVEMAFNLPSINPFSHKQVHSKIKSEEKPSTFVEFEAWVDGREVIIKSDVIHREMNPVYNASWKVHLPAVYLFKTDSEFEVRVVMADNPQNVSKAYIDLTTLSAGLNSIDGWFLLSGNCGVKSAGQIKVMVSPLEDISKFKCIWTSEYKQKRSPSKRGTPYEITDGMTLNDSTYSSTLMEKMQELDDLTKKMKKRIDHFDSCGDLDSSDCELADRVRRLPLNKIDDEEILSFSPPRHFSPPMTRCRPCSPPVAISDDDPSLPKFRPVSRLSSCSNVNSNFPEKRFNCNCLPDEPHHCDSADPSSPRKSSVTSDASYCSKTNSLSIAKCLEELQAMPKDSLEAASIAIERIIAELRKQKLEDVQ